MAVLLAGLLAAPVATAQMLPPVAHSGPGWDAHDLQALSGAAREIQRGAAAVPGVAGIAGAAEAQRRGALPMARETLPPSPFGTAAPQGPAEETDPVRRPLLLFVSGSLGEAGLREALRAAAEDGATTVVWQGLAPGERLRDAVLRLAGLIDGLSPIPSQSIDPPAFRQHRVTAVPTILDPQTGAELRGSTALHLMRARLRRLPAGQAFSEAVGPTSPVIEADLAQELQARAAGLDLTAGMRRSAETWWARQPIIELPVAPRDRVRHVDPTLYLQADLRGPGGAVLAAAGTRVNPLEQLPLRAVLLVFDARDPRQVAWASRQVETGRPVILLASAVDRDAGWEGHVDLTRRLGHRVHLLSSVLRSRLGVEFVPARIEAEGSLLRVEETAHARLPRPEEPRHAVPR